MGEATGNAITIYKDAPTLAKYHEAFHPVYDLYLTDKERADINAEFRSRAGGYYDLESGEFIEYKDATDYQIADRLAEEFGQYKQLVHYLS